LDPQQVARLYQTAVLLWGKGSGKDYLCSILVCYLVYVLLCLRDPQVYLRLAPGEPIDLVNVAYNADQAKNVFFEKLKQRVKPWQWLRENYNLVEAGRRVNEQKPRRALVSINDDFIEFPHQIRAWSRHAQNESYEGLNVLVWLMDEASAFLSKLKRENAEAIHHTLKTSAASRFGMRYVGLIISWPRHADDFTMTKHKEAVLNPELGVYADGPASTWEINELTKLEPRVQIREGLEVPASLANDFISDPRVRSGATAASRRWRAKRSSATPTGSGPPSMTVARRCLSESPRWSRAKRATASTAPIAPSSSRSSASYPRGSSCSPTATRGS